MPFTPFTRYIFCCYGRLRTCSGGSAKRKTGIAWVQFRSFVLLEVVILDDLVVKVKDAVLVAVKILAGCAGDIAAAGLASTVGGALRFLFGLESTAVFSNLFVGGFACSHEDHSFRIK